MVNEKELAEFVAQLPKHLRFFFEAFPENLEGDEVLEYSRTRLAKVRQHRDELVAHGIAADRFIADMEPRIAAAEKSQAKVDQLEDKLLHARADLADAEYKMFRETEKLLKHMEEQAPFDPLTEQVREDVEEWRKHFPKDDSP